MKTNLASVTALIRAMVGAMVLAVYAPIVAMAAGDFKPCCRDGSSPWASESPDTFKSNARAGYQGAELPPSTGYNPDQLDGYEKPANSIYNYRQPSSETPPVSSETNPQRYGGDASRNLGRPDGTWRGY